MPELDAINTSCLIAGHETHILTIVSMYSGMSVQFYFLKIVSVTGMG